MPSSRNDFPAGRGWKSVRPGSCPAGEARSSRAEPGWARAFILFCVLGLTACHPRVTQERPSSVFAGPGAGAGQVLRDDGDKDSLHRALAASIRYWRESGSERRIQACGQSYGARDFLTSLREFEALLTRLPGDELAAAVDKEFDLCQVANNRGQGEILVTGYYQPRFKASRSRTPPFIYPLYRPPADLIPAQLFAKGVTQTAGRLQGGRLVPYWSRAEIETSGRLQGNELCYLRDPVDVFTLQVQGSGVVEFTDGTERQLLFAGTNGRPYRSIGRLLADEGRIPLAEIDMPRIRRYLHEHLDERQRILHYNERYVFFRLAAQAPGSGPVGSMGAVLTPGRSVALDQEYFPVGGLYFLKTERPPEQPDSSLPWRPMTRFVLHQDTGAAIAGPGRLDFFWGSGDYPERAAGLMKQPGRLYLLMKKRHPGA